MSVKVRSELSKKNKYWIERHRYYELKHFCLQYPIWKKAYAALDGFSKRPDDMEGFSVTNVCNDPTAKCAIARENRYGRTGCHGYRRGIVRLYFRGSHKWRFL